MAIRIVCETPDKSVLREVICDNCGVKLEFAPIDVKNASWTDYGGGTDHWQYISCPKCERKVDIKDAEWKS